MVEQAVSSSNKQGADSQAKGKQHLGLSLCFTRRLAWIDGLCTTVEQLLAGTMLYCRVTGMHSAGEDIGQPQYPARPADPGKGGNSCDWYRQYYLTPTIVFHLNSPNPNNNIKEKVFRIA